MPANYKGSGPLTTDLLGGQITMSFDTITPVLPQIKAGKLRALAVTTATRSSSPANSAMRASGPAFHNLCRGSHDTYILFPSRA